MALNRNNLAYFSATSYIDRLAFLPFMREIGNTERRGEGHRQYLDFGIKYMFIYYIHFIHVLREAGSIGALLIQSNVNNFTVCFSNSLERKKSLSPSQHFMY